MGRVVEYNCPGGTGAIRRQIAPYLSCEFAQITKDAFSPRGAPLIRVFRMSGRYEPSHASTPFAHPAAI